MRAFALPRVARAAWLVLWLVLWLAPALALAAPKKRPKKAPAKKAPVTKPAEPAGEAPAPDPQDEPEKDARTPASPSPAAGSPGGAGAGGAGAAGTAADARPAPPPADKPDEAAEAKAASGDPDVDTLRQEYLSLRDELFKSRARANAVASQLYSTRMQIRLTYTTGRYYSPVKTQIRLDGAVVYEDGKGAIADDDGVRFDGYVAPGRHLVTFRVEAVGKDDDTFASVTESQVTVKAVAGKDLVVAAKAKDGGDIAYEWKKSEKGSYGLGIDVAVKTQPAAAGGAKGSGK